MTIGLEEWMILIPLLDSDQRAFDEICDDFITKYSRELHSSVCCSIATILKEKSILKPSERLIAFAILHRVNHLEESSVNQFTSFLIDAACNDTAEKFERAFILMLLGSAGDSSNIGKEIFKQSASDFIRGFDPSTYTFLQREQLLKQHCDKVPEASYNSIFRTAAVKNVITESDIPCCSNANSPEFEFTSTGAKTKIGAGDRDGAVAVQDGGLVSLNPDYDLELLWDSGMRSDTNQVTAIRVLIAKALKGLLAPPKLEKVFLLLADEPKLVYECGLTPRHLPKLVEQNWRIAVKVLANLNDAEYFSSLVNMDINDMNLDLMCAMERLTTTMQLPKEFVQMIGICRADLCEQCVSF